MGLSREALSLIKFLGLSPREHDKPVILSIWPKFACTLNEEIEEEWILLGAWIWTSFWQSPRDEVVNLYFPNILSRL